MEKIEKFLSSIGYGDGDGYGSGYGDGYGYGEIFIFKKINGLKIHIIDGIPTAIISVFGNIAKGFTVDYNRFSCTPCFIAKNNAVAAHGATVKDASDALREKLVSLMNSEERIAEFCSNFKDGKKYKGEVFFNWHHILTGSCHYGREQFVKSNGLSLDAEYTVNEFIKLTEHAYGCNVIKQLKSKFSN